MHESITIQHDSGTVARIAPELGFNCFSLQVPTDRGPLEVLDAPADFLNGSYRPSHYGIPLLFPFPNRIQAGRYSWDGREYQMPLGPGHPHTIHGFALDRAWSITEREPHRVVGEFLLSRDAQERRPYWPADCRIEVEYAVGPGRLESRIRVENVDEVPLPWGFGTHAYFRLPLVGGEADQPPRTRIAAPAHAVWELNACIPTGQILPSPQGKELQRGASLLGVTMDDVFTDLRPAGPLTSEMQDQVAGWTIWQECDPALFRELVVYTPPGRPAVCMEPYTCVTDAINLAARGIDSGWRVLPPGESVQTWINIRVDRSNAF